MVYSCKRKINRGNWEEKDMEAALAAVRESGETILNASKSYNVTYGTLHRHLKKGTAVKTLGRYQPVFTKVQGLKLKEYTLKNGLGYDWYKVFKERHTNITLKTPEPTSVARARGFNKPKVNKFYDRYSDILEEHKINATTLLKVDETGIATTSNIPPKILSSTGKKTGCCSASGQFLPSYFIFARKKMVERLLDGIPLESEATCMDNGWINGPAFLLWLQYFVHQVRRSPEKKVLPLMDNHIFHKYYPTLEFARVNNVVFLSFLPHTTNKLQRLDRAVYGPFKTFFEQEINTFQKAHLGKIVNQLDITRLVTPAFLKSASAKDAVHGFSSKGVWPFNRNIFGEERFASATVTNHPPPLDKPVPNQDRVASPPDTPKQFLEDQEACSSKTSLFQLRPLNPYETRN
ncbi:hypothetical protein PR048_016052 [Dryococelus australis]|uniref:HTH psq-type domain-containing protein n=1 Tax=Dryococelus australis TaxID=614101 RepID=A0ABQ9HIU4_9NEOP|nr:hypothetical protein PR048_016052 [Dryococelus australis]